MAHSDDTTHTRRWFTRRRRAIIAYTLFVITTALMVLGAVVGPKNQPLAQDAPDDAPGVAAVEGDETSTEDAASAERDGTAREDPASGVGAAPPEPATEGVVEEAAPTLPTELAFEVDPDASTLGLEAPVLGGVTSDATPRISGRAAPETDVEVFIDGASTGTITADADGRFVFTPEEPLDAGSHTVRVAHASDAPALKVGEGDASSIGSKAVSFLGIFALLGIAVLLSNNRRKINWKLVGVGVTLQLVFAVFIFYVPGGKWIFSGATSVVKKLLDFTNDGSSFIFSSYVTQQWEPALINFTFSVLPTIIFFSSLMTILYHLGIMQRIVYAFAWAMQRAMGTSGAESLSAAANIFVGQTEAPLVIKPYVDEMTNSELMTVMTGGFATVAGGVLALYVGMLESSFPDIAGHLLAASVMSAPAALVVGKIIYPETETPKTSGELEMTVESEDSNVIDAASRGASEGLELALNVAAMLLAFLALIALLNYIVSLPSLLHNKGALEDLIKFYADHNLTVPDRCTMKVVKDDAVIGCVATMHETLQASDVSASGIIAETAMWPMVTIQTIFGYMFWPFAFIMGVPVEDCVHIGRLLGEKMVLNELVAYTSLKQMVADPAIQLADRSVIIATYALCGFANFGSIGIQLGGIGGLAPNRRGDLAKIALRAMIAGTLAAFMTATVAGILV